MRSTAHGEWLKLVAASLISSLVSVSLVLLPSAISSRSQPQNSSVILVDYPHSPAPAPAVEEAVQLQDVQPEKIIPAAEEKPQPVAAQKNTARPGLSSDAARAVQPPAPRDEYFAHHYEITVNGTEHILALAQAEVHPHPPRVHYYEISVRDR